MRNIQLLFKKNRGREGHAKENAEALIFPSTWKNHGEEFAQGRNSDDENSNGKTPTGAPADQPNEDRQGDGSGYNSRVKIGVHRLLPIARPTRSIVRRYGRICAV